MSGRQKVYVVMAAVVGSYSCGRMAVRYKTKNYIDAFIGNSQQDEWRFTGFYGEPKWQDKHLSWQCLQDLHAAVNLPWLVMGDINEFLYSFEKEGGNP